MTSNKSVLNDIFGLCCKVGVTVGDGWVTVIGLVVLTLLELHEEVVCLIGEVESLLVDEERFVVEVVWVVVEEVRVVVVERVEVRVVVERERVVVEKDRQAGLVVEASVVVEGQRVLVKADMLVLGLAIGVSPQGLSSLFPISSLSPDAVLGLEAGGGFISSLLDNFLTIIGSTLVRPLELDC